MTRNARTYDHACLTARTLELVGERWTLLVIRDLLTGPKRFTDLMDRLGGITPKTLSHRLDELEDADLVSADREAGRREVWYALTPAGADLRPVVDSLGWWGLRHAWRAPRPGEPLHAEHLLRAAITAIDHAGDDHEPACWHFRIDGSDYFAQSDGHRWTLTIQPPAVPADVTITATTGSLAAFVATGYDHDVEVSGDAAHTGRFRQLISTMSTVVNPQSALPPRPLRPQVKPH
jgi:DNA-binding HxlR family transcriptional regulator